jgi:RNA polymerase sigma-B factor
MPYVVLPVDPESAIKARRFVREHSTLDSIRHTEADLLVTELVANVVRHSPDSPEMSIDVSTSEVGGMKVSVSHPFDGELSEERGIGHTLVDRIARTWGIRHDGETLGVWFTVRTPGTALVGEEIDDSELFRAMAENPDIASELVSRHSDLANSIARRYRGKGIEDEDLEQVAHMALLKAIQRFDESVGSLRPFAAVTISGEMKKLLRDKGWSVRVPRSVQELVLEVTYARADLTQRLGRAPDAAEIAREINVDVDQIGVALEASQAYTTGSLEMPSEETGLSLLDRMEDPTALDWNLEDRLTIADAIERLPERQQQILHLRFNEDMTQSEIAEILDISQMHVSRLLSAATDTLRADLADPDH